MKFAITYPARSNFTSIDSHCQGQPIQIGKLIGWFVQKSIYPKVTYSYRYVSNPIYHWLNRQKVFDAISLAKTTGELHLIGIHLEIIPEEIAKLTDLKVLNLSNNHIKVIPEWIINLNNLERLNLEHNNIRAIPRSICQLDRLRVLNLSWNQIETIPNEIVYLCYLKELS